VHDAGAQARERVGLQAREGGEGHLVTVVVIVVLGISVLRLEACVCARRSGSATQAPSMCTDGNKGTVVFRA